MHRRFRRGTLCPSSVLLACTTVVLLAFFVAPSREQNLDAICSGRVFALPRHIRIACDEYLSRTISVGNTDSQPGSAAEDTAGLTDTTGRKCFFG